MVFNIPSWNINNIFSLNIPLMFLLCFFLFILCISPCFFFVYLNLSVFLNLIHFYLIYYQESIIKLSALHTVEIASFLRKKTGNKIAVLLFLATKRLCSLLITGRQYSLLVIQISSRSQISSKVQIFEILVFAFFR